MLKLHILLLPFVCTLCILRRITDYAINMLYEVEQRQRIAISCRYSVKLSICSRVPAQRFVLSVKSRDVSMHYRNY